MDEFEMIEFGSLIDEKLVWRYLVYMQNKVEPQLFSRSDYVKKYWSYDYWSDLDAYRGHH